MKNLLNEILSCTWSAAQYITKVLSSAFTCLMAGLFFIAIGSMVTMCVGFVVVGAYALITGSLPVWMQF